MKCAICKNGDTCSGKTTIVLERDKTTLIFKDVPAEICENCGEEYFSSVVNNQLLQMANEAAKKGIDLEMLRYAA
jgi:YgiT-type zinc finger domain-containing protein